MDRFERFELPTPFDPGTVNCYCFVGSSLTLVDPGPLADDSYETLATALERIGHSIADVGRILLTHPHIDHYGSANRIQAESGASVVAHRDAVWRLRDPIGYFEAQKAVLHPFFRSMGVPEQVADDVTGVPDPYIEFQEAVDVDRILADRDHVDDLGLHAVHTPGHAPGSVCLVDTDDSIAFTGDHVLPGITPNPLLSLSAESEHERTRSLPRYLASLRTLRRSDASVGFPGHGGRIPDLDARIQETIVHHRERKERIHDILLDEGPMTAYALMESLFPDISTAMVFPGLSEAVGHLDLLEDENRVELACAGDVCRYVPS